MLRNKLIDNNFGAEKYFRWRGGDVSRLEGFSDSVFAFAVTLLVVSLEVPKTFDALLNIVRGFISFGICFTLLIVIWYKHYLFFRRYGLNSRFILVLNSILLFVMIFYIYPLKFLFTLLIGIFFPFARPDNFSTMITNDQAPSLMIIYGIGCILTFAVFFFLYKHALKQREQLELNEYELVITKAEINEAIIYIAVPAISIFLVLISPKLTSLSGFIYFLLGPLFTINGIKTRKRINTILRNDISSSEQKS